MLKKLRVTGDAMLPKCVQDYFWVVWSASVEVWYCPLGVLGDVRGPVLIGRGRGVARCGSGELSRGVFGGSGLFGVLTRCRGNAALGANRWGKIVTGALTSHRRCVDATERFKRYSGLKSASWSHVVVP